MVLKTDKQLSFSSEIASTIGLEEAILLQVLTDVSNLIDEVEIEGNYWNSISFEKLKSILQFWNQDDIHRVFSNLSNIGILRTNNSREKNDSLTYSLRTAVSSKKLEHSKFFNNSSNQIKSDSIEGMSLHWSPNEETLRQLEQLGVTKEFSLQQVPQFVSYWRERNVSRHSWSSKFIKEVWREWQKNKSIENIKNKSYRIDFNWKPSSDVYEILSSKGGINTNFIEDAIPEFVLYWKERGDKSNTWDSKFVQHVKRQWNFYTGLTEINNEPVLISSAWKPKDAVYDVLAMANIDRGFAENSIKEFIIYWQENGTPHQSWSTKFLQYVKRRWAFNIETTGKTNGDRQQNQKNRIRNRSIIESLEDRSWAS